jgi:hypothetical protein
MIAIFHRFPVHIKDISREFGGRISVRINSSWKVYCVQESLKRSLSRDLRAREIAISQKESGDDREMIREAKLRARDLALTRDLEATYLQRKANVFLTLPDNILESSFVPA